MSEMSPKIRNPVTHSSEFVIPHLLLSFLTAVKDDAEVQEAEMMMVLYLVWVDIKYLISFPCNTVRCRYTHGL